LHIVHEDTHLLPYIDGIFFFRIGLKIITELTSTIIS
jgi:hypothetical protein